MHIPRRTTDNTTGRLASNTSSKPSGNTARVIVGGLARNPTEEGEIGELQDLIQSVTERPRHVDRLTLDKAIKELPRGYRMVFVLHDVEGFEHEEIAKMLGVSVGTSKSQLHKARMKLRDLLNKKA